MIKVGVYGGSGYMGGEAIRVLSEHPEVHIEWITSRGDRPLERIHRNLRGFGLRFVKPEEVTPCDVVFAALPSGTLMTMAAEILSKGTKIIDLGADFRLRDRAAWERKYATKHARWELVEQAVYGIAELHRDEIRETSLVANPGCYSSAAILALAPLVAHADIDLGTILVDGLSGTAGAGSELHITAHHPEIANNIVPYNVVDHRHTYEIEQELSGLAGEGVVVHFTTSYVPISRGILAVCHSFPRTATSRGELLELYNEFYRDEEFVHVIDAPTDESESWQYEPYPWVAAVSGTNFCHIGLDYDRRRNRIVVFSVLDSIGKGGAHVAVQNMNLMFGLPEDTGLRRAGLHPY
ncbi:MAG: N-acetyl-gamma-glutamyl-phosphate reductase [Spirochaetales bacterium]|nr:N-acetyl-gamma-glutamyl-phosphate reductase [Spirochaetales bacterium]